MWKKYLKSAEVHISSETKPLTCGIEVNAELFDRNKIISKAMK